MAGTQVCAVCGKPMDAKQHGNFHIKIKVLKAKKHAHPECVQREPEKARAEGF